MADAIMLGGLGGGLCNTVTAEFTLEETKTQDWLWTHNLNISYTTNWILPVGFIVTKRNTETNSIDGAMDYGVTGPKTTDVSENRTFVNHMNTNWRGVSAFDANSITFRGGNGRSIRWEPGTYDVTFITSWNLD